MPNWLAADQKFKFPCDGSGFNMIGFNFEGTALWLLARFAIYQQGQKVVVNKSVSFRQELGQWALPGSYISVSQPKAMGNRKGSEYRVLRGTLVSHPSAVVIQRRNIL